MATRARVFGGRLLLMSALVGASFAVSAAEYVWIGGSGDWSDASNWKGGQKPVKDGTAVVSISNEAANVSIRVDESDISIKSIRFVGASPVSLSGEGLTLTAGYSVSMTGGNLDYGKCTAGFLSADVAVDCAVSLAFTPESGDCGICTGSGVMNFREKLFSSGKGTFYMHNGQGNQAGTLMLQRGLDAPDAFLSTTQHLTGDAYFYGPVSVKGIKLTGWTTSKFYFYSSGNELGSVLVDYYNQFYCRTADVFPETTVLGLGAARSVVNALVNLGNYAATIDRLGGDTGWIYVDTTAAAGLLRSVSESGVPQPTTLTMKASQSDVSSFAIQDEISLVWDPKGDYELTLTGRVSNTSGSIDVRRGGFRLAGSGTLANVSSISIGKSARFSLASISAGALAGLTALDLAENAVFACETGVSQSCPNAVVAAGPGTEFHLAEGCRLSVAVLSRDGTYLENNKVYTKNDFDWIVGDGEIVVNSGSRAMWKSTVSGRWGDSSCWANGRIPDGSTTDILIDAPTNGSYTVTIDTPVTVGAGKLVLRNGGAGVAKLAVASGLTVDGVPMTVGTGGLIDVGPQGVFTYRGSGSHSAPNAVYFKDGGSLSVSGGEAYVTNFVGIFSVASVVSETSRVEMTSGRFLYMDLNSNYPLSVGAGGKIDFRGGTFNLPHHGYNGNTDLLLSGGTMTLSNTTWSTDGKFITQSHGGFRSGTGEIILEKGASVVFNVGDFKICPNAAGETARLVFRNGAQLPASTTENLPWTIGGCAGGVGVFDYASGDSVNKRALRIGSEAGAGKLNVKSGILRVHDVGLKVGYASSVTETTSVSGEAVVAANADLNIVGSCNKGWGAATDYTGIVVGHGHGTVPLATHPCIGRLDVYGSLENRYGPTVVGSGFGTGFFVQHGGTVSLGENTSGAGNVCRGTVAIGVFGGEGQVVVSNGTFNTGKATLFVGGCTADDFFAFENTPAAPRTPWLGPGAETALSARHDAVGTLTVASGVVQAPNDTVVGGNGVGVLEMIGSVGSFTTRDLVLSNATASIVRFVADAAGVAPMTVTRKLIVTPATQLVLDVSRYAGSSNRLRLVSAAEAEGAVVPGNVTVVGAAGADWTVRSVRTGAGIEAARRIGMMVIVR